MVLLCFAEKFLYTFGIFKYMGPLREIGTNPFSRMFLCRVGMVCKLYDFSFVKEKSKWSDKVKGEITFGS